MVSSALSISVALRNGKCISQNSRIQVVTLITNLFHVPPFASKCKIQFHFNFQDMLSVVSISKMCLKKTLCCQTTHSLMAFFGGKPIQKFATNVTLSNRQLTFASYFVFFFPRERREKKRRESVRHIVALSVQSF